MFRTKLSQITKLPQGDGHGQTQSVQKMVLGPENKSHRAVDREDLWEKVCKHLYSHLEKCDDSDTDSHLKDNSKEKP